MKLSIPCATLADMIAETYRSTSKDAARAILTGILFESDGDTLRLVATDTHRLSMATRAATGDAFSFILGPRDVMAVKKLLRRTGTATIELADDLVSFTTPRGEVCCQTVDGTYPNYRRVIPAESALEILCDRAHLTAAFSELMAHKPYAGRCNVNTADGVFLLSTDNAACADCDAAWLRNPAALPEFEFAVNGRFALDLLAGIPSDVVRLRFQPASGTDRYSTAANLRPIMLDGGDDTAHFSLLMPMQIV